MLAFNVTWLMEIKKIYLETASDKLLLDKTFNIAKISKQERYQHRAAFLVDKFLIRSFSVVSLHVTGQRVLSYMK